MSSSRCWLNGDCQPHLDSSSTLGIYRYQHTESSIAELFGLGYDGSIPSLGQIFIATQGELLMTDICERLHRSLQRQVHATLERLERAAERSAHYIRLLHYRDQRIDLEDPNRQLPNNSRQTPQQPSLESQPRIKRLAPPDPRSQIGDQLAQRRAEQKERRK